MAERERSHVWSYFISTNSQDAVCDICGKAVKSCGSTTNLVKHLRTNHNTEYETFAQRRTEEQPQIMSGSFGAASRHYPGTERENAEL